MSARGIRAVFFDLDDTLFDHAFSARTALSHVRRLHESFAAIEVDRFEGAHARILEELHLEVMTGRLDIDLARVERFRRLAAAVDAAIEPDFAARAAAAYRQQYIDARREVAGAAALLAAERRRAAVGIISNNLLAEQQAKLRHCGLDRFIDVLVVSEEAGSAKPERTIFELALQRAGCRAEEAVMIGDAWENDVEGARRAGMRAIWFDPSGRPPADPAVEVLRSLEPAEQALQIIFGRAAAVTTGRV